MELQKIKQIVKIALGIDFILCALTVFFMKVIIFPFNFEEIHVVFGGILLFLGAIHIATHFKIIKKKHSSKKIR